MISPRKYLATLATLLLGLLLCAPTAHGQKKVLPPGEGKDVVENNCTACHAADLILQNRMSREKWDATITWMQEKQGLWELSPETRRQILDYLEQHQGVKMGSEAEKKSAPDRGGAPRDSMQEFTYPPNPL